MLYTLRVLYFVYAAVWFIVLLLFITPAVLWAMALGQPRGGHLIIRLCRFWSDAWCLLIGIRHRNIYQQPIERQRHYVFVANHTSYLDIPLIFQAIRHNDIRVLGKAEMARIPLFGILYRLAVVLVDRSSPEKRARSVAILKKVLDQNTSIFIFPEGTFNETEAPLKHFYDGAFRIAIETGTPIKPIVFLDAKKLMHYRSVLCLRPGLSRAVILPEIPVTGLGMQDLPALKKLVFDRMEKAIIEFAQHERHIGT
jgi:1-acyl-sn-glycerol-3-phosphate acyltransferase